MKRRRTDGNLENVEVYLLFFGLWWDFYLMGNVNKSFTKGMVGKLMSNENFKSQFLTYIPAWNPKLMIWILEWVSGMGWF